MICVIWGQFIEVLTTAVALIIAGILIAAIEENLFKNQLLFVSEA